MADNTPSTAVPGPGRLPGKRSGPELLLVYDTYAIGDVLQRGSAVAAALRSVFPQANIDLAVRAMCAPLLRTDPNLRTVFELERCLVTMGDKVVGLDADFAAGHYDAVINAGYVDPREIETIKAVCAHFRQKNPTCLADMGMAEGNRENLLRQILAVACARRRFVHRVDYVLANSGMPTGFRATLRLDNEHECGPPDTDRRVVFLHTQSRAPARAYPLGDQLAAALNDAGYFVWGAESGERDIREVAWMIRHSDYVVTVDTCMLHIANGLGVGSLCLVTQILAAWVGVDDFCFQPVDCVCCISRKIRGHESEPCELSFACMKVDPAEIVARVNAYFQMQTLRDSPLLRRYLQVRLQQYALLEAIQRSPSEVRVRDFDVLMTAPAAPPPKVVAGCLKI